MNIFGVNVSQVLKAYQIGLFGEIESIKESYQKGETPWPITYLFMPDEIIRILKENGIEQIDLAGPGAFSRSIPNEILVKIMNNDNSRKEFLEFCYMYDKQPWVAGLGKDNLLAVGVKSKK